MSELTSKIKSYLLPEQLSEGEVGLEIEVEGRNLYRQNNLSHWRVHEDGSLRGENAEYVLKKPIPRDRLEKVLEYLNKKLENSTPVFSHRTSVHVHLNAQELTGLEVYKWITLYTIFEGALLEYCGDSRKGNLFCLGMAYSQGIIDSLSSAVQSKRYITRIYSQDSMRYAAMNTASLAKFGSLEFRSLYGTLDPEVILPWVEALLAIKDKSQEFTNPIEILQAFSTLGVEKFVERILPESFLSKLPSSFNLHRSLSEHMWLAQEFVFQDNWKPKLKKKPQEDQYYDGPEFQPDDAAAGLTHNERVTLNPTVQYQTLNPVWTTNVTTGDTLTTTTTAVPRPASTNRRSRRQPETDMWTRAQVQLDEAVRRARGRRR